MDNRNQYQFQISRLNFQSLNELFEISTNWQLLNQDESYYNFHSLVYQDKTNKEKCLKIYPDYAWYKETNHHDEVIISLLQQKQKNIKLTEFPYGIVSINNKVIGYQMKYYDGYLTFSNFLKNYELDNLFDYFLKVIDIIKELVDNKIFYIDIHDNNFLINPFNNDVKLVDFDESFLSFSDEYGLLYDEIIKNLKLMFYNLASIFNIDLEELDVLTKLEEIKKFLLLKRINYLNRKVKVYR